MFKAYARKAAERNLTFSLTLEEFKELIILPCFYCGEQEKLRGVDRWDNNIGYEFENCRPCCEICNRAKLAMDGATFVNHFRRMAEYTQAVELSDLIAAIEQEGL